MSIRPAELPLPMCRDAKKERFQARCGKTGTRELGLNSLGSYLELECGAPTESPASCWGAPGWWNHWSQMMGWPSLLTPVWQLGTYVGQPLWLVPAGLFFFFFCYVKNDLTVWLWLWSQQFLADLILLSFSVRWGLKIPQKQNNTWYNTVSMAFQGAVRSRTCSQQKLLVNGITQEQQKASWLHLTSLPAHVPLGSGGLTLKCRC